MGAATWPTLTFLAALLSQFVARAQTPTINPHKDRIVCPLSESQTQNAIAAFAKMVPTFTEEPRCVNCHGGVDPFLNPESHAGGEMKEGDDCGECHDNMPPRANGTPSTWRMATRAHFFLGKDTKTLCEQMKSAFFVPSAFLGHMKNDNGSDAFVETAFLGTRGLNEAGQALAFGKKYEPQQPTKVTAAELNAQANAWIAAMGGKFQGDDRCGCEPVKQAIRVFYTANLSMGAMFQELAVMGPVDLPITFHDDHTFEGEGTLPFAAAGFVFSVCAAQSQGGMKIKISGKAVEEAVEGPEDIHKMNVELTNVTPATGTTSVRCPYISWQGALKPGDKVDLNFNLQGLMGEEKTAPFPLPAPVVAKVQVKIVELGAQPATPK